MSEAKGKSASATAAGEADRHEQQNILTLILHQICFRTAWIFKTESVMMPAFLDSISGAGWIRGLLPPLNRFGQSLAPLLLSDRLSQAPLKSRWLSRATMLMSLPFLAVGGFLLFTDQAGTPLVIFFLTSYLLFFCLNGINQAAFNTIQGKLIQPQRRGRLMAVAGYIGSPTAVLMAWLLLRRWTESDPPKFSYIFLFTGCVFLVAGFAAWRLKERPDPEQQKEALHLRRRLAEARLHLRHDPHLRRLCLLAAVFVCSQLLFPHYQRLGRSAKGFEGQMLMIWVIAQNLSAAAFSWFSGWLADRHGTRSSLRWLAFLAMFAPAAALLIHDQLSAAWYWLSYVLLGAVPVCFRMFLNYSLELTDRRYHPIYVSTVVLCMAPPIIFSPLIGEWVERAGYVAPFSAITVLVLVAWVMTLRIVEPRTLGRSHAEPLAGTDD